MSSPFHVVHLSLMLVWIADRFADHLVPGSVAVSSFSSLSSTYFRPKPSGRRVLAMMPGKFQTSCQELCWHAEHTLKVIAKKSLESEPYLGVLLSLLTIYLLI